MKKIILASSLLILINISVYADDVKPRFYISTAAICDSAILQNVASRLVLWQENLAIKLQDVYQCASINTQHEVYSALNTMRKRHLLGAGNEDEIKNLAKSLTCDYLINLKMTVMGETALLSALCMDYKTTKTLSRAVLSMPFNSISLGNYENLNKQIIEGLKTTEICPFKGEITLKVVGILKEKQEDDYPVNCNGIDGRYKKTVSTDNYSESDWSFYKKGLRSATGNVKFNISEETIIDEFNPCFDCTPTKQGPRSYYEKKTTYSTLEGLSKESEANGIKVNDARMEITFFENGTYTLRIKAASDRGQKKTKKEVKAEGVCQNINDRPEPVINKIDVGVNEIFGPFTGNAQDRTLFQRATIERVNPLNQEKETLTYEFNLTRD